MGVGYDFQRFFVCVQCGGSGVERSEKRGKWVVGETCAVSGVIVFLSKLCEGLFFISYVWKLKIDQMICTLSLMCKKELRMKLVYVSSGCIFPSECGNWEANIELCGPFWLRPEVFLIGLLLVKRYLFPFQFRERGIMWVYPVMHSANFGFNSTKYKVSWWEGVCPIKLVLLCPDIGWGVWFNI